LHTTLARLFPTFQVVERSGSSFSLFLEAN